MAINWTSSQVSLRVAHLLAQRFCARTGVDLTLEGQAFDLLCRETTRALAQLGHLPRVTVSIPCVTRDAAGSLLHLDDVLLREDVEAVVCGEDGSGAHG